MEWLKLEWKDVAWVHLAEKFTSFPWFGLPADVHFTLSYHPDSDMMNLHLTRNSPGVNNNNKPQMRIAQWPKSQFEEMARIFAYRYFNKVWEPFDMRKYQRRGSAKNRGACYCSISRLTRPGKTTFLHRWLTHNWEIHKQAKRRGRHMILQESLFLALEQQAAQPAMIKALERYFTRVPLEFTR